jgi:hypothetical protein
MAGRLLPPTVESVNHRSKGAPTVKQNPFIITACVVILIVVGSLATLGVLSAFAGQMSGLEKSGLDGCPSLNATGAGTVGDPGHTARLEQLVRCAS